MRAGAWLLVVSALVTACAGDDRHGATTTPSAPPQITPADLTASRVGGAPEIAPRLLERRRIAGEKLVVPDSDVITAAAATGATLRGMFKYCLDETGHVATASVVTSTQAVNYDAKIVRTIKTWAFQPVVVDGKPTAVCSAATFVFTAR